jgi:hypothetical protein
MTTDPMREFARELFREPDDDAPDPASEREPRTPAPDLSQGGKNVDSLGADERTFREFVHDLFTDH